MTWHTELVLPGQPAATSMAPLPARRRAKAEAGSHFLRRLNAAYESAKTTDENERYWANADFLSPVAAGNAAVRTLLRSRARYEVANNSYATGMMQTLAYDIVGTGPRLQMGNEQLERDWATWCRETRLCERLRTAVLAKKTDGEVVGQLQTNRALRTPAKLQLVLFEADRLATPDMTYEDEQLAVDGIRFDRWGNPVEYHILRSHPGSQTLSALPTDYDKVPASKIVHWYREDRPGQRRGIPELTPALSLFANLRRYTMATIAAAETAASFAAVMYTDQPVDVGSLDEADWFSAIPIEYRSMLTLPDGWKMGQFQAQHPTSTHREFQRQVVAEMARCLCMPYNIAAGDSSEYNYASGRLDHLTYWQAVDVERSHLRDAIIEPVFAAWMREHLAAKSGLSVGDIDVAAYPHTWIWPMRMSADPLKDAQAMQILFSLGLEVDEDYWIRTGRDPDEQRAKLQSSIERRAEINAPIPGVAVTNRTTDGGSDANQ